MNIVLKTEILRSFRTQADLAQAINIREDRLSRIVRGRVLPKTQEMIIIAEHLGCSINELFGQQDGK